MAAGNILDDRSAALLADLADQCAEGWMQPDSGIWELPERRHYTMSKISCWQALARAVDLAGRGHISNRCQPRWERVRDRISAWIAEHCWSERKQAYVGWAGGAEFDASLALAARFGFDGRERVALTIDAIDRELASGPFHYRLSGASKEEGCFLACSFWMVEAKAILGRRDDARTAFEALVSGLGEGAETYPEMIEPKTGAFLGNLPQGLTHLALVHAASSLG